MFRKKCDNRTGDTVVQLVSTCPRKGWNDPMNSSKGVLRLLLQSLDPAAVPSGSEHYVNNFMKGVGLQPSRNRVALFKLCVVAISSLYFGGFIAHKGASFLEENEIFIPSDDDDDD
ncbi:hypothetical protein KIN20_013991 [Parelaphostrongylus tenuis]|uniref:Essential MCU regulator, mitochondrial n=1 Tax=Parelaphostrongylus tenuis TaxID=148309 RepID=A0AAD5MYB5_PARTN|nr:hypothetical protein KIN20_013991 [Parelaphostrongylus tenuis]